jgi:hypothetical protein
VAAEMTNHFGASSSVSSRKCIRFKPHSATSCLGRHIDLEFRMLCRHANSLDLLSLQFSLKFYKIDFILLHEQV